MNKKKYLLPFLTLLLTFITVLSGIFLPELLLNNSASKNESTITQVPENYYSSSSSAMAKKASEQLGFIDRTKLVTGAWERNISPVSLDESTLTELEAVNLAKSQIEKFYETRCYPYSLESDYNNWYSWSSSLYKCVDTTFNTYITYFWVIDFTKYDNSLHHTVVMTEDGTILAAQAYSAQNLSITLASAGGHVLYTEVNNEKSYVKDIKSYYESETCKTDLKSQNISVREIEKLSDTSSIFKYPYINYGSGTYVKAYSIDFYSFGKDTERCIIFQHTTEHSYTIGIVNK